MHQPTEKDSSLSRPGKGDSASPTGSADAQAPTSAGGRPPRETAQQRAIRIAQESQLAYEDSQQWRAEESRRRDKSVAFEREQPTAPEQFARLETRGLRALEEREAAALADARTCDHNADAATGKRATIEGTPPPNAIVAIPVAGSPGALPSDAERRSVRRTPREAEGLGCFSRARRRELWSRLRHWQTLVLHPQRVYRALRELRERPGGEEALGRFMRLLEDRGWHPTHLCSLRRFVAFMFGMDVAKPYNWGPRSTRAKRLGLARLGELGHVASTWGLSQRGIGQVFLSRLFASGDGEPVDRSTIAEIYEDLASVGLCAVHQPPNRAKLAPFERGNGGKGRPFNQYWFAMIGNLRKPAMRGPLDDVVSWTAAIDAWFARLARLPTATAPPLPAS